MRREQADQDAGGADADDRPAIGEEPRQQQSGVVAIEAAVEDFALEQGRDASGDFGAAAGKGDDGGSHAPGLVAAIAEDGRKIGALVMREIARAG